MRITGCGFDGTRAATLIIKNDGQEVGSYGVGVWADGGCIDGGLLAGEPGQYTIEAYQNMAKGRGKEKLVLQATTSFTVQ